MSRILAAALVLSGCHPGSGLGAATIGSAALAASAIERSAGGCYAVCTNGTACNSRTGLCEVLPCRAQCGSGEHCETTFSESKCVPGAAGDVTAVAKGKETKVPFLPPMVPNSSGPPDVVPAAQQNPPAGDNK